MAIEPTHTHRASGAPVAITLIHERCKWHPGKREIEPISFRGEKYDEYEVVERGDARVKYDKTGYQTDEFIVPRLLVGTLYTPYVPPAPEPTHECVDPAAFS